MGGTAAKQVRCTEAATQVRNVVYDGYETPQSEPGEEPEQGEEPRGEGSQSSVAVLPPRGRGDPGRRGGKRAQRRKRQREREINALSDLAEAFRMEAGGQ